MKEENLRQVVYKLEEMIWQIPGNDWPSEMLKQEIRNLIYKYNQELEDLRNGL